MPLVSPSPFRRKILPAYPVKNAGPHQYGCLLLPLPEPLATQVRDFGKSIDPSHLAAGGLETEPHITVKYGFEDEEGVVEELQALLTRHGPVTVRIKSLDLFRGNPDGDVLHIKVGSEELYELNRVITETFLCVTKHPVYVPHITVAYLQPNYSQAYATTVGQPAFCNGPDVLLTEARYTTPAGKGTDFPLAYGGDCPCCPQCGARGLGRMNGSLFCKAAPCDWSVKALSAFNESLGGALVPPAEFRGPKARKITPSPFLDRKTLQPQFVKAGFTGRKPDKNGVNRCYQDGRQVSCAKVGGSTPAPPSKKKPTKPKPEKPTVSGTVGKIRKILADPKREGLQELLGDFKKLKVAELRDVLKELKESAKVRSKKSELEKQIGDVLAKVEPLPQTTAPENTDQTTAPENTDQTTAPENTDQTTAPSDLGHKDPEHPIAKAIAADADSHKVLQAIQALTDPEQTARYKQLKEETQKEWNRLEEMKKSLGFPGYASPQWLEWENSTGQNPELRKASEKWMKWNDQLKKEEKERAKLTEQGRKTLRELLAPKNPPTFTRRDDDQGVYLRSVDFTLREPFKPSKEQSQAIDKAIDFVKAITEGTGLSQEIEFQKSRTGRAYFNDNYKEVPHSIRFFRLIGMKEVKQKPAIGVGESVSTDPEGQVKTMVHELGHYIDDMKPGVRKKVQEFITYRLGDEAPVDMGTVPGGESMKGEMVRKDDFDKYFDQVSAYYVGKVYKDKDTGRIQGSEIVSMGLEALYTDPVGFCASDPEYAQFIIGILRM